MISCIVDGFDPWEQVETLLRRIREDMIGRCEVILVASLLLDTPPEVCRSCGEEWFGNSFRMLRNDDYSIFRARLRAQELARGDTILYLSPSVVPAKGTLAGLAAALEADPSLSVCSAPLAFLFPGHAAPAGARFRGGQRPASDPDSAGRTAGGPGRSGRVPQRGATALLLLLAGPVVCRFRQRRKFLAGPSDRLFPDRRGSAKRGRGGSFPA